MKEINRDALLGLVFFGAIALLAYFTIYLTEFSFIPKQQLRVRFVKAQGLKAGDPVLVLGTRSGRVLDVFYDEQTPDSRRVVATLQMDRPIVLKKDYQIQIEQASFLGGRQIAIDPGLPENSVIGTGPVLIGTIVGSPLNELGFIVKENREDFHRIISGIRKIVERTEKGEGALGKFLSDESVYNNLKETIENAKTISEKINTGKGTLGRLLNDETLANNISTTVTTIGEIARDLRKGKGTLGKLLTDDTIYNNVSEVAAEIRAGRGTIGKLIYDKEIAKDLSMSIKNFREITEDLAHGEGTLAKLLHEDSVYENINSTTSDLKEIVADVRAGKGTLGKLLTDDTLYNDLQTTLQSLNRSIEDGREAAPIGTFSALLFSSF